MFANERQNKILAIIRKSGAVSTSDLVEQFNVSTETIRRDLLHMENSGLLSRVHGGAVQKGTMQTFSDLKGRSLEHSNEKSNLSKKATEFISEGDIIGIDTGSTAILFAEEIRKKFSSLTVITHSLDVFNLLSDYKDFKVILCGGHFLPNERSFFGPLTANMIDSLHFQKVFLCPMAVSLKFGISDFSRELFQIQQHLLRSADEVYILADSSKFEKNAIMKLDDMKDSYTYITDGNLPCELKKLYSENNIKIYTGDKDNDINE
ncbi:MAG: DeoR/GlpR transcriptional regulator [Ruminococcaceae bacterium]|nr:DeoR/GlpR transcriptional regulator [Oscillospiraceae bacterium]